MKYLSQFLIILAFSLLGEALQQLIPLPIPAAIYGLVLLFGALFCGFITIAHIKDAGSFLTSILPILFVSPMVGIAEHWELISSNLFLIVILILSSTVLTFGVSECLVQRFTKKGGSDS